MNFNPEQNMPDFPEPKNDNDYPKPGLSDMPASVREESQQPVDPVNSLLPAYQADQAMHTETANMNLAHLTEQRKAIEETATNSERTADALEEMAKQQEKSNNVAKETNLKLEVIRREIDES